MCNKWNKKKQTKLVCSFSLLTSAWPNLKYIKTWTNNSGKKKKAYKEQFFQSVQMTFAFAKCEPGSHDSALCVSEHLLCNTDRLLTLWIQEATFSSHIFWEYEAGSHFFFFSISYPFFPSLFPILLLPTAEKKMSPRNAALCSARKFFLKSLSLFQWKRNIGIGSMSCGSVSVER